MIGKTISHYKILEKLGEGGMGVVYKAEDTKLKRTVALKFLPPELTSDEEAKERFIHEAQAASALQHNNICNIHDIDQTADGQLYMVMDCYEGEPLKEKVDSGSMKLEEVIDIAVQVASGLSKAHEKGIVHRDIKPANVFITTDGTVKILDFGLAKLIGQSRMTKTGSTVGTAEYMSPEQAQGLDVDHRTDIWSLGVVLYEMLTGQLPFRGEYEAALMYSIVHEAPQAIYTLRADIPHSVISVTNKMLHKDRSQRYQTVKELMNDLNSAMITTVELPKQEKSIVVLPFDDLSPDRDQEYFSDGLTEEIISDLSAVRSLRVISRSSAMTFKGTKKKIPEIAREVNVQYVLEGSVRKTGNNFRITAQVIDATNDTHLWAEKYSGTLDDVFDIQEKISHALVNALRLKLTPVEEHMMTERPIDDIRAYECYLKANAEVFKMSEEAINRAIQYLQNAIGIIGSNALLYSGMAWSYWMLVNLGLEQEDYILKAEDFARKAMAVDADCAQAHTMLGYIAVFSKVRQAVQHFKKALSIRADDALALQGLAMVYDQFVGKIDAAIPLCERLTQIDPFNLPTKWHQGGIYFYDGQFDLALAQWQRWYEESPENPVARLYCALTKASLGRMNEVLSIFDKDASVMPNDVFSKIGFILRFALLKDKKRAF